jgi:hypothetical protein
MADGGNGLRILNTSNPEMIEETGFSNPGGGSRAASVFVENNLAYVAALDSGLRILDISDKSMPEEIGVLIDEAYISNLAYSNNFAYMLCGAEGMKIADVSDPTSPLISGWFNTSVNPIDIAAEENLVYVTAHRDGLYIIKHDITIDPVRTENVPINDLGFTCYPNPFRTNTAFGFNLQSAAEVSIHIKNILGQHVATILHNEHLSPGSYSYHWRCDPGKIDESGIYISVIETSARSQKSVEVLKLVKLE